MEKSGLVYTALNDVIINVTSERRGIKTK